MSRFFIDRPIFAWVLAILIMLAGILSLRALPIAQFPPLAPPAVSIQGTYPGADAQTLENTTTTVIEQQMKGIDHLRYMSSVSDPTGTVVITLTFEQGTDPDTAQVQVQNKLQLATPRLPAEVQQAGLTVAKASSSILLAVAIYSEDGSHSVADMSDLVASRVQDPVSRVSGVGDLQLLGGQYAMRIWVDPYKLQNYGLTVSDVKKAIIAQNAQVPAGQIGGTPANPGQPFNATVTAQSRLRTTDQFAAVLLRTNPDGSTVSIKDVARVEMGSEDYNFNLELNGKPASGLIIKLASGANALETIDAIKARIASLQRNFPPDVRVVYPLDTSPFVRLSVEEVVRTIAEAMVLVFLVMFLFLQNWRATIIPTITIPVVLLGTLSVLAVAGYSINTLTLFGMVLAIGLLVDDAIVVVENVERIMAEQHLSPREATQESMREISGALVAIAMVLAAVFVPMAFFSGSTGIVYRQFSITIVSAMGLSVLVALILTPALCATLLKPHAEDRIPSGLAFVAAFNRGFDWVSKHYVGAVGSLTTRLLRTFFIYAVICVVLALTFIRLPGGFLPDEDQGFMFTLVRLPPGSTMEQTTAVMRRVQQHYLRDEAADVEAIFSVTGFSPSGAAQNIGQAFIKLKPWSERQGAAHAAAAVAGRANAVFARYPDSFTFAFMPPAALELGNATGFNFVITDESGVGHAILSNARDTLVAEAQKDPRLAGIRILGQKDVAQLEIEVDHVRAGAHGLTQADVNDTISTAWGGTYVNDFIDRGRVKRVYVEADSDYRSKPDDLNLLYIRSAAGLMTPFAEIGSWHWRQGPALLERYNGMSSFEIDGQPAPGYTTGTALKAMEDLAEKLPAGIGHAWTGISYEEKLSAGQAPALYALSVLIVFLCLAALYESWSIPFAVLPVVPLGAVGAVLATTLTGGANDVFFQVGLITTIGVSTKNAILIIEFAATEMRAGQTAVNAALTAARMRLRPILMTSFAFAVGVLPLAISTGAGSGGQNAIGRSVVGGMLSATLLAIFFIPIFFIAVSRIFRSKSPPAEDRLAQVSASAGGL